MKKIVLGGMMMFTSIISISIFISVTLGRGLTILGRVPFMFFIRYHSLEMPFYILIIIAAIGFALSLWGLIERKKNMRVSK